MKGWVRIVQLEQYDVLLERKTEYKDELEYTIEMTVRINSGTYRMVYTFFTEADQIEKFNSINNDYCMQFIRSLT